MADSQESSDSPLQYSQSEAFNAWPGIAEFYAGRDILVTGATGFMGKCLLEKILRSLPQVRRVYVLTRPKRDKSIRERLDELGKLKLYERVRSQSPDPWEKIIPINGDISLPKLGVSDEDEEMLAQNVSIVFHLAATIQFNCSLKESIQYNVVGVQEMIKLCRKMKQLESFVHVSTAYAYCQKQSMDEMIYPNEVHYKKVLNIMDWFKDDMWETLTPSLLEGRPNTYTYSKSLGEQVIAEEAQDLPTAILRPSIIGAAVKEPLPGWIDCFHGPGGLFVATGKGLLRVLRADINGTADIIPVDFVNNMLLAIGWETALKKSRDTKVYHCNTGTQNPITWIQLYPLVIKAYYDNPFDWIFHRPHIYLCQPAFSWPIWHFFLHNVPAYVVDLLYTLMGRKAMLVRMYTKLKKAVEQLDFFTQNSWQWSNDNGNRLRSIMRESDREDFNFDPLSMQWKSYVGQFCMGTKKYLVKDDPNNLTQARQQITRLRNIRYTFNFIAFLLATRLVYLRSRIARELWSSLLGICLQFLRKIGFPSLQYNSLQLPQVI